MKQKMDIELLYLQNIKTPAANILKQDALSIGADLAVEKDTILCKDDYSDALLIANKKQLRILAKKELKQPFGLKTFAKELNVFFDSTSCDPKIMGVVNANDDSFYEKSRFKGYDALRHIDQMITQGADIIDIGGVSSRPGSQQVSEEEELHRVKPIIDMFYKQKYYENVRLSLDSYSPLCVSYALNNGFDIINDITGLSDDHICALAAEFSAEVVIMHMQGDPSTMQNNPTYENVILEVEDFFQQRVEKAKSFGIEKIILDVGIGFGKSLKHNLLLIKHLSHFQKFGLELLIGASRKSMIDKIDPSSVDERLPGTLTLHQKALEAGAGIIRCHDVKEHRQMIKTLKAMEGVVI